MNHQTNFEAYESELAHSYRTFHLLCNRAHKETNWDALTLGRKHPRHQQAMADIHATMPPTTASSFRYTYDFNWKNRVNCIPPLCTVDEWATYSAKCNQVTLALGRELWQSWQDIQRILQKMNALSSVERAEHDTLEAFCQARYVLQKFIETVLGEAYATELEIECARNA